MLTLKTFSFVVVLENPPPPPVSTPSTFQHDIFQQLLQFPHFLVV